ncbi:hypothetical protein FOXYS1_7077 [Fusarium oxysporum]|uniref:Uncharacterized protein n=1 Tax=Fusarium oxysporum TaxID=5507 RepID=A0A8H5EIS8_FUSOX|nr:hypothetical protein FOXYS1_7077 [Fusarium oxysporum]
MEFARPSLAYLRLWLPAGGSLAPSFADFCCIWRLLRSQVRPSVPDPCFEAWSLNFDQSGVLPSPAVSIAIVEEIKKEVANQQKLSSAKTDPASIKRWQDAITKAKLTVTKLEATAKSFPGSSSNAPKMNNISVDKKDNSAVTAALSTATEKLALNQKALETAQANYTKAVEAAAEVQKRLTGIQTKLKGIEIAGAALERVKEILIECIAILVELKVQISKLTTFFNALSTMVKVIIETKVKNFDTDATAIGQEASQRGLLKLNDLDIETIYISTLQIKAYFDLLQMICQMYTTVHAQYVNPGLDLLTELSKVTKTAEEIAPKRDQLNSFTDAAHKAINELVAQKQQEISDGLQSRIDAIAEQTDMLHKVGVPMPAAGIIQAMRTGGEVIQDAVKGNLPTVVIYGVIAAQTFPFQAALLQTARGAGADHPRTTTSLLILIMLQPSIFRLAIRKLTQKPPLLATNLTHAQPRLFKQLHQLKRTTRLAQLTKFLQTNRHSKLLSELDVDQVPDGLLFGGFGIIVWCAWSTSGSW